MSKCDKDCVRAGEPHQECAEHGEVPALRARISKLEAQGRALADIAMQTKAEWEAQRAMTVHRLGGEVEGAPTHAGNFLQRVDQLRGIERAARSLLSREDFWQAAAMLVTLPGEIDNLAEALASPPTGDDDEDEPPRGDCDNCGLGVVVDSRDFCVRCGQQTKPYSSIRLHVPSCRYLHTNGKEPCTCPAPSTAGTCERCHGLRTVPSSVGVGPLNVPCPACGGTGDARGTRGGA